MKSLCAEKKINKLKREPTKWENISINDIPDKRLVCKIYKEFK